MVRERTLANRQRVAVIASYSRSLTNFRLELLKRMVESGHSVTALAPEDDEVVKAELARIGVRFIQIPMARAGLNPFGDFATLLSLWKNLREIAPDTIVPYTMKPIVYGGIAARLAGVKDRCFLVTGLGHVFSDAGYASLKGKVVRKVSVLLYRLAFAGAKVVFVYNDADEADIRSHRMLKDNSLIKAIPGSGVDLEHYAHVPPPMDRPRFLLIARLLKDKGIEEYVEAARRIKARHPDAEFQLLGPFDPNPAAISPAQIEAWVAEGVLNYLGETRDVRPFLAGCNVFVLPSYYREGIPRSLLEAMATGRAVITTNLPGCRDTVEEGVNGFSVEPRNPEALSQAMAKLADDLGLAGTMGERSRELVRARFDVHQVNRVLLERMQLV
ncbi:glycosyltransferase family 4 protein [Sinorhizobium sp. BG8]|uniref:glycosyltransferase family 4 protein n=1 Tax=Sinorhizobium sp. BG8 TaxID=2613773 RepID=UPI001FEEC08A|nr:glycosyltransferase family 4 protein [Sinorhizobium sp. BG8]